MKNIKYVHPEVFSIIKSLPIGLFFCVSIPTDMDLPFLDSVIGCVRDRTDGNLLN